jgi:glyoxylase-like metal-dependent hydrolase (beta-lactamase superfamily II)
MPRVEPQEYVLWTEHPFLTTLQCPMWMAMLYSKCTGEATGAELLIHRADAAMVMQQGNVASTWGMDVQDSPSPDRYIKEGDVITFGDISLKVLHTPGHSAGGISLVTDNMVFVGDTLFAGSIGRTDFPGGSITVLKDSIDRVSKLDVEYLLPGHSTEMGSIVEGKRRVEQNFRAIKYDSVYVPFFRRDCPATR